MARAHTPMKRQRNDRERLEALLAADATSVETGAGEAARQGQSGLPSPADQPERERRGAATADAQLLAGHSPECPRARAAQQLARQAEEEARKYLQLAASVSSDLRSNRARQRMGWMLTTGASGETPE